LRRQVRSPDGTIPPHRSTPSRLVADRVPGAAFVALPGAHLINVEAADRVNSALADHLS
jgi:hypothetical protein